MSESEVEFFEDALRDIADDEHDRLPLEWHVEIVLLRGDGLHDGLRDLVHIGELLASLHACCHRSLGRAGLDGQDGNALAVDAISQAAEKGRKASFRRAVDIVRFAASVTRYR